MNPMHATRKKFKGQEGFTLLEAVMATAILITGLAAVTNLMFVAISSNTIGNRASAAAFLAAQKMEQLRSISFQTLAPSNNNSLDVDQANFFSAPDDIVEGVGTFHTTWQISIANFPGAPANNTKFIAVRTEMRGALGRLTRAEFTSFRACTLATCP